MERRYIRNAFARAEQYGPLYVETPVHDWSSLNSRGHFLNDWPRKTERGDAKRNDDATPRETNEPADARPLLLITPINLRFLRK